MGEWAKASIEKKNFKFKSGRVGSGRVSNLELVDNKRAPNSRVGKGVNRKKKNFNRELWCRFESEIREWVEMDEWGKASIKKK
jgi:hypothetical protein